MLKIAFGSLALAVALIGAGNVVHAEPAPQPAMPSAAPAPPNTSPSSSNPAFNDGLANRRAIEEWFASLSGDFQKGAAYWASCYAADGSSKGEWTQGCLAAQQKFAHSDVRRKAEPEYRAGWNSFTALASQPAAPPTSPPVAATQAQIPSNSPVASTPAPTATTSSVTSTPPPAPRTPSAATPEVAPPAAHAASIAPRPPRPCTLEEISHLLGGPGKVNPDPCNFPKGQDITMARTFNLQVNSAQFMCKAQTRLDTPRPRGCDFVQDADAIDKTLVAQAILQLDEHAKNCLWNGVVYKHMIDAPERCGLASDPLAHVYAQILESGIGSVPP